MNGSYLLDTNVVIALFAQNDAVRAKLRAADETYVSSVVVGELYYGARKSANPEPNIARIDEFAASVTVLGTDLDTARRYGEIKMTLQAKGRPIPENDIWIAAACRQHDLVLATRDDHFQEVAGLNTEAW